MPMQDKSTVSLQSTGPHIATLPALPQFLAPLQPLRIPLLPSMGKHVLCFPVAVPGPSNQSQGLSTVTIGLVMSLLLHVADTSDFSTNCEQALWEGK